MIFAGVGGGNPNARPFFVSSVFARQALLGCSDAKWATLQKSTEMFELMDDWETKKTDNLAGKKVWISIGGILDLFNMSAKEFEEARKQFNATSTVRLEILTPKILA